MHYSLILYNVFGFLKSSQLMWLIYLNYLLKIIYGMWLKVSLNINSIIATSTFHSTCSVNICACAYVHVSIYVKFIIILKKSTYTI